MAPTKIIIVVRSPQEAALVRAVDGGRDRVHVYVAGESKAPTPPLVARVRRSPDPRRRRTPVIAWVETVNAARTWRNAGAFAQHGPLTKTKISRAILGIIEGAHPWVETANYVGPCRRARVAFLSRSRRRLADGGARAQERKAQADEASIDTQIRALHVSAAGLLTAGLERRAQFLADVKIGVKAAERARRTHAQLALESLVRYLAGCGANGPLDPELVLRHVRVAEGRAESSAAGLADLAASVDRVLKIGVAA